MNKKSIIVIISIIFTITISIISTAAFLSDYEKNNNVYTIGNVSITLDETKVNELGIPIENAQRVYKNEYHLLPGYTYYKDPTITVESGSNDAYVRMLVTINKINELNSIFEQNFELETLINNYNEEIWLFNGYIDNMDNSYTYEFRYYQKVNGYNEGKEQSKKLPPLFESFTIPEWINNEQLAMLEDLEINILGQAIQEQGFYDNIDKAWDAFELQMEKQ